MQARTLRRAGVADAPGVARLVARAYAPYLARMDRRPAPATQHDEVALPSRPDHQREGLGGRLVTLAEQVSCRRVFFTNRL